MTNFDLIFDNGGGITLQTTDSNPANNYTHYYDDAEHAAQDISDLMDGADPAGWDNNDTDCRKEYDHNTARNGGYHWVDNGDVMQAVGQVPADDRPEWLENIRGRAEQEFFAHLFLLRDAKALQQ